MTFLQVASTTLDLFALVICLGALLSRFFVFPPRITSPDTTAPEAVSIPLNRLLAGCLTALTLSSLSELVMRTAEMSGRPLTAIAHFLLPTLIDTHYGQTWLVRPIALMALWIGWGTGKKNGFSSNTVGIMLCAASVIAMTRCTWGHASRWGDMTVPEIMDWLHLMAVSAWGGGILVFSVIIFPNAVKSADQGRKLVADIARRFSVLSGIALGILVISATYNAWLQVGSTYALLHTDYGQLVFTKILLAVVLAAIGASNRYGSVPLLQQWAGNPATRRGLPGLGSAFERFLPVRGQADGSQVARMFLFKLRAEAILVTAVLVCTAFLLQSIPSRHLPHLYSQERAKRKAATKLPPPEAAALWTYVTQTDPYQDGWDLYPGKEAGLFMAAQRGLTPASNPHGAYMKLYANDIAVEAAREAEDLPMPGGAILIEENYARDKTTLLSITVMYKVDHFNSEAGDWFWAIYAPDGKAAQSGKVQSCIGCHRMQSGRDWRFAGAGSHHH